MAAIGSAVGRLLIVAAAAACLMVSPCNGVTIDEQEYLVAQIRTLIDNNIRNDEYGVPFKSLLPTYVRLGFHMCVSGVCDGCINIKDSNNAHLAAAIQHLVDIRRDALSVGVNVSLADLMALAATVSIHYGEELAAIGGWQPETNITKSIRILYGRRDCATAPYTTAYLNFPAHTGGVQHVVYWFQSYQKLTAEETVAIMGFHKLGGLRRGDNDDIYAQWAYAPDVLDNAYYRDLCDSSLNWKSSYVRVPGYKSSYYMWRQNPMNNRVMFNCDMGLFKDLRFESCDPYNSTCTYSTCPQTYLSGSIARRYATDNEAWLTDASKAFQKMVTCGYAAGDLYEAQ